MASKAIAGVMLAVAGIFCLGQSTGAFSANVLLQAPSGNFSQTSSSANQASSSQGQGHKSGHHVQVPEDDAQPSELTRAEAAIEKKDYAAAEGLLRKLVGRDSANYEAWFDLGFVENSLGNVPESIAAYRKSVAAKPDVFESNLNLGLQLAKSNQPDAEDFLQAATKLKPTSNEAEGKYRAWLSLAQIVAKSRPEEAIGDYQQAALLEPKEIEPHLAAGLLYEQGNKFSDAEIEYKKTLAIDAHSSDAVVGLANIYMRGHRFSEAEEYLRKLVEEHPKSAPERIQLGRVLAAEGKTDAGIAELQAGMKLAPGDETVEREVAELYATAGKNDLAEASYRELVAAHPNDAELHDALGKALMFQKKSAEAQKELAISVKLKPAYGDAYYDLAFAANDTKDYPTVIGALDARAKLLAETPMTYFLRASAYDHLRDFKKAAANFHLFLKVANGKYPDQEWQATHRLITIEKKK